MNYKKTICDSFNKGSESYDMYSKIQVIASNFLLHKLLKYLKKNRKYSILELGSGTGHLTSLIAKNLHFKKIVACDISSKMILKSKKKVLINKKKKSKIEQIFFLEKDFDKINFFNNFNLITSNMSLHWSENISKLINNILSNSQSDSIFSFTVPNNNSFSELSKEYLNTRKSVVLNSLPDHELLKNMLKINKTRVFADEFKHDFIFPNALDFLRQLKRIGTGIKLIDQKNNLFFLRSIQKKTFKVSYYISCFIVFIND